MFYSNIDIFDEITPNTTVKIPPTIINIKITDHYYLATELDTIAKREKHFGAN
jgi:hypothetical protein